MLNIKTIKVGDRVRCIIDCNVVCKSLPLKGSMGTISVICDTLLKIDWDDNFLNGWMWFFDIYESRFFENISSLELVDNYKQLELEF